MPPKAKFTREEMIATALQLVRKKGMNALTARELADDLHCSSRPIFTIFNNMEELQEEVIEAARQLYHRYIVIGLQETLAFRGVGLQYIRFACEEPILFHLLFMNKRGKALEFEHILSMIDQDYQLILKSLEDAYQIYGETSKRVYQHLWIYTHGIAVLSASNVCAFQPEEMTALLTEIFLSLLKSVKAGDFK